MWTLIIGLAVSLGIGYIGRWYQDYKVVTSRKKELEAQYRLKVHQITSKVIEEYESEKEELRKMPKADRLKYIADRVR
jgi:hypothetical protein